ncbi:MAG: RecX family transcriptional regulator [Acidobacteriota bacterium]
MLTKKPYNAARKPRVPKTLERNELMNYAAQAMAARAQSAGELRTRLLRKAAHKPDVDEVVAYFKDLGYLNDEKFAGMFADWRRENQGIGQAKVMRDLLSRKVAPAVAKQAVADSYKDVDETALIDDFLRRKYRGKDLKALLAEPKHLASAYRKLRMAGFGSGNSIKLLKGFAAGADELEDMEVNAAEAENEEREG